jgi:hypothetical protein
MSWLAIYLTVYGVLAFSHIIIQMIFAHLEYLRQKKSAENTSYYP